MSLRLSQRVGERKRTNVTLRARNRGENATPTSVRGNTDEWVRLDSGWRIIATSTDLAPYLDAQDPTAMALAAWPAIGSAERLVSLMGLVRDGTPAVAMPAGDGRGVIVVTCETTREGTSSTTTWRRAALTGALAQPGDSDHLLAAVAAVLSHDGIAPLRRAVAFADAALAADADLSEAVTHRMSQTRDHVLDAADLVREIVATLRVDASTAPGRCELAALHTAVVDRCRECGVEPRWDLSAADPHAAVTLTVDAAAALPVFAACALISAAVDVAPVLTRTDDADWTVSIACPASIGDGTRLLRLGASLRDGEGRTIRPRLALAARQASANGWQLTWDRTTLVVHGMCIPARKDS